MTLDLADPGRLRPPHRPDPLECCNRGCCPCIFDYYYDALERWRDTVRGLGHDPERILEVLGLS